MYMCVKDVNGHVYVC